MQKHYPQDYLHLILLTKLAILTQVHKIKIKYMVRFIAIDFLISLSFV